MTDTTAVRGGISKSRHHQQDSRPSRAAPLPSTGPERTHCCTLCNPPTNKSSRKAKRKHGAPKFIFSSVVSSLSPGSNQHCNDSERGFSVLTSTKHSVRQNDVSNLAASECGFTHHRGGVGGLHTHRIPAPHMRHKNLLTCL